MRKNLRQKSDPPLDKLKTYNAVSSYQRPRMQVIAMRHQQLTPAIERHPLPVVVRPLPVPLLLKLPLLPSLEDDGGALGQDVTLAHFSSLISRASWSNLLHVH